MSSSCRVVEQTSNLSEDQRIAINNNIEAGTALLKTIALLEQTSRLLSSRGGTARELGEVKDVLDATRALVRAVRTLNENNYESLAD